ncbi:MAG: ATP-binding protein [Lachnospiraceae bacterium]|nr:ATP-binding protein [Lachnospiraceae bacterium]
MKYPSGKYDAFMNEYEQLRNNNLSLLEARKAEIYARVPELKQVHEDLASGAVSYARARLSGKSCAFDSLEDYIKDLKHKEAALLLANGYPEDSFAPIYRCRHCKDTGFIDGTPCACLQQKMIQTFYMQSNIQKRLETENFEHLSFDYYNTEADGIHRESQYRYMQGVVARVKNFAEDFDEAGGNLFFYGPTSLGKTFLANCVAKALLDQGHTVLYMTSTNLFEQLLPNVVMKRDTSVKNLNTYDHLFEAELLVIDDLGTELITEFTRSQLYQLVNERLLSERSTIISTNMELTKFRDCYEERILSRMIENYTVIQFYGDNIRHKKKKIALSE